MPNILFLSNNELFQSDLTEQIGLALAEDYKVYPQDDDKTVFDVALLDGKEFLPAFREKYAKIPAIILEPSESEAFTENNLDIFMFKPLILPTLLNQIQTTINVFENSTDGFLRFGDYELRPREKEIYNTKTKKTTKLTEREVNIIQYLYKSPNDCVSKNELLQNVWEYSSDASTHTIETHIYRLRKKVEQTTRDKQLIQAEEGGYKLIF